ncbi:hypothetical protein PIB30_019052 [Stylosanthes scabra]|uniref:Uncharacterized protein n=1 Tax=Stylosanthes scabra TaxID=79078 RepID=A0ABU6S8S8_9FABA|nr:hypothetical protein [Stylosanthes scabra]
MGRMLMQYLAMKTTDPIIATSVDSDVNDGFKIAATKLFYNATMLGGIGFGSSFLKGLASFAAIGEIGKWIASIAVVLRLFFPRHFPDWLELPGSMILLLVVAPDFFAIKMRNNWVGLAVDLVIGCYLLQEHIRASGGFRNSFTQRHGISNTLGILQLHSGDNRFIDGGSIFTMATAASRRWEMAPRWRSPRGNVIQASNRRTSFEFQVAPLMEGWMVAVHKGRR